MSGSRAQAYGTGHRGHRGQGHSRPALVCQYGWRHGASHHATLPSSLQAALASQNDLLRGTGSWLPSSTSERAIRDALLSFRNAPSLATWTDLSRWMILPSGKTAWQVWADHDSGAPHHLGSEGFTHYPDPEDFFRWIPLSAEKDIAFHREKLDNL